MGVQKISHIALLMGMVDPSKSEAEMDLFQGLRMSHDPAMELDRR